MQATVVSFLKDSSALKKQMFNNNIPSSEEEEDEHETTKAEEDFILNEIEHVWCDVALSFSPRDYNTFIPIHHFFSIHTPPPESIR